MSLERLMRVLQFGDSVLPIGSFAFSNSLEPAVQAGVVKDAATLAEFARATVRRSAVSDGIALLHAHRAAVEFDIDLLIEADQAVFQRKLSEEARTMAVRMGKKLAEVSLSAADIPLAKKWLDLIRAGATPGSYQATLGLVFASVGSPEEDAFAVHQYGTAMTTLSAALRLMRIGHDDVQAILASVCATATDDYAEIRDATLSDMAGFAPGADVLAAMHVRSHVRLFMN